jgi:hypothetical protein
MTVKRSSSPQFKQLNTTMNKNWLYKLQTRAVVPLLAIMPLTSTLTEKHGFRHLKRHNVALRVSDKVSNSSADEDHYTPPASPGSQREFGS